MLQQSHDALERWKGFDKAIDRWLDERHELIVLLSEFAAHHDFDDDDGDIKRRIDHFQTLLIDYVSAGHFEFYQRLIDEGVEYDEKDSVEKANELLEQIEASTQSALDFNDKYEYLDDLADMGRDLSRLAEALVSRFQAEDEMIDSLHRAHVQAAV